jgi:hypothetical protein
MQQFRIEQNIILRLLGYDAFQFDDSVPAARASL